MRITIAAILLVLVLVVPVRSGQEITIVRGQDFPPYHYLDDGGRETGVLVELIQKAAQDLDLAIQFRQLPWSRCLRMIRDGKADAMMNLFKTPERETFMIFAQTPLAREVNRLFTLRGRNLTFTKDFSSLEGINIGAIRNYSYGKVFDQATPRLRILRLETEKAMIKNLIEGRCDAVIGNEVVIRILAGHAGAAESIAPLGPGLTNDPLYLGFSKVKGHQDLAQKFSRALKAAKATPAYQTMLKSYGF